MANPTTTEALVMARLGRELQDAGVEEAPQAALDAARAVLVDGSLSADEAALLDADEPGSADPVAAVLAARIERALREGLAAAGREGAEATEVLVLRSAAGADKKTEGAQTTRVLARWREYVAARKAGGEGRLLILAAPPLYKKVQKLLPSGKVGGKVTLEFLDEGLEEQGATGSIEIVPHEVRLAELEELLAEHLDGKRPDSAASDSMKAAWLAAHRPPGEAAPDAEPAPAGTAPPIPAVGPEDVEGGEPEEVDPMIGKLFHLKYRIVRCLGRGGFGAVYEAEDERGAGNRVAIKVLFGAAAESAAQQDAFKDEARRVTKLSHPNVVDWKVFDETEDGVPYFVMELVDGEEFEETLRRDRKIAPERAGKLLLQVLDALRAAHHLSKRESILHLDLKPANLFRVPPREGREEQVKVLDFGIGQYIGDGEVQGESVVANEGTPASEIGHSGTLTFQRQARESDTPAGVTRSKGCTPEYASPEQVDHVIDAPDIVPLDGRSDLYSLGVVAFEMLTGQLPFKAKNRLSVLQMHREDPAPKVGSMGVRIPHRLAKFVDRCLEKDRDRRWKDTNEAYQFLYDVVHPPVWKAVAKVTVPIVAAGVALGAWAWATREVVVPTASLVSEAGADLEAQPLYLGPTRTSAVLALQAAEGVVPRNMPDAWRVVRVADGTEASGWTAEWAAPGSVALRAPLEAPAGRTEERVALALGEDRLASRPFTVVWIGSGTWDVSTVEIGGRALDELRDVAVDPYGLALDVSIRGEAREDLAEVSVRVGDASPLSLARTTSSSGRSGYRLELADAGLRSGANEVVVSVRDEAGGEWSHTASIAVVTDDLALTDLAVVDADGERDAAGRPPESNKILDAYLVSPRTRPALWVELSRPADVRWSVTVEGADGPAMRGQAEGRRSFELDLAGLDSLRGGDPFLGRVELAVDEDPYVLHAAGSGRGEIARSLPFRFEDTLPTFAAQWRAGGATGTLAAGPAAAHFTNAAEAEVVVTRDHPVPMRVEVAWWPAGRPGEVETRESTALLSPQTQQTAIPVLLPADGEWVVRARSYRFDTAAEATSDRPDVEETFAVVLDREAPSAALVGLASGQVLRSVAAAPAALGVRFGGLSTSGREAAVDLAWTLARTAPESAVQGSGRLAGHDPSTGDARMALEGWDEATLLDGVYRLAVTGSDRAGNAVREASVDFVVATRGPAIALTEPSGVGKWRRDPASGRWPVRALATDANGVESVTCEWIAGDTVIPIALRAEGGSSASERALVGSVVFPHTLSEAKVRLAFTAADAHGAQSAWTSAAFELPAITRPAPDRIAVSFGTRPVEPMRLVRGNDGFQYFFGGRGDAVENGTFVRAGLGPFNESPRRSRSRSWQVPFAAGEIEDYYLDEREVSVAQFLAFVRDPAGYTNWSHWPSGQAPDPLHARELRASLEAQAGDLPVTGVSWAEANAYAHWVGKRLPSWVEWEYAVRGGAEYRPYAGYEGEGVRPRMQLLDVRVMEAAAPRGSGDWTPGRELADLSGNVAEWTGTGFGGSAGEDRYPHRWALEDPRRLLATDAGADTYWVAGGHFGRGRIDFALADHRPTDFRDSTVGFRCAVSLEVVQDRLGLETQDGPVFTENF